METSYSEHDYKFGQTVLTLRTAIGLTQAGLATRLGVSRRAVGEWEAGSSYPKVEHLKGLIALAVESQAFPAGNASQEIRTFWKEAHQKLPLDEAWLSSLLDQPSSRPPNTTPPHVEETRTSAPVIPGNTAPSGPDGKRKGRQRVSLVPPTSSQSSESHLPVGKFSHWIYITITALLVLGGAFVLSSLLRSKPSPDLFPALCGGKFQSGDHARVPLPAVSTSSDGEPIGLSEGAIIFDLHRPNLDTLQYKHQAARATMNDPQNVESSLKKSLSIDQTDAEAWIYLENWRVLGSNHPHITFVVGVNFQPDAAPASRGALQGAYTAQKECNEQNRQDPGKTLIVLMIANIGRDDPDYPARNAEFVTNQLVDQARKDATIVGILGWLRSANTINVNHQLKVRGSDLSMVSPISGSDELSEVSNIFRISPASTAQVPIAANFMLKTMQKKRIAILYDTKNSALQYNLAIRFANSIPTSHNVGIESYTEGDSQTLQTALNKLLTQNPDAIFFAGYVTDLPELLKNIPRAKNLLIVGGNTLANTMAYPNPLPNLQNVYFTAFASPNRWDCTGQTPPFFQDFKDNFGAVTAPTGLPSIDPDALLGYDALLTLLHGTERLLARQQTLTPSDLTKVLHQIKGTNAIQGVTGRIAFKANGDQEDTRVILEHIEETGLKVDNIQGCFLLTDTCAHK
jgi:ABC-type branched-subunit amino acid transport system substrate-binding protein/transcriptional regulator with XRE-family HTH domain